MDNIKKKLDEKITFEILVSLELNLVLKLFSLAKECMGIILEPFSEI